MGVFVVHVHGFVCVYVGVVFCYQFSIVTFRYA